jgi:hypothetical protein
MFKRTYRQLLIVAVSLSSTGLAAAHSPPSLVRRQAASEHATQRSAGYRDLHARFGDVTVRAPRVMKAAGGYRDIVHRFPNGRAQVPTF